MKLTTLNTILLSFCASFLMHAQERPPIQVFAPTDYQAETQNWSIAQSDEKYIYVANNKGLLEYNGGGWRLYNSPNESIVRCVNVIDNVIYTGCNREFGFWKRNQYGALNYTSLSSTLKIDFLEEEEFWNIIGIEDYILFQSLQRIYIFNKKGNSFTFIESETVISKMFKVNESIYFQKAKDGLYKIDKGQSIPVCNDPILKSNLVVNVFFQDGKLLIETEDNGFYFLEGNNLVTWSAPANSAISNMNVFRSARLKDNSFIIGTRSDGIMHVTTEGNIDYHINTMNGLSNNTIHFVFEDADNNIWLALDNGINCINIKSPFSTYNDDKARIGTVYASAIFNNNLYLGTNQGLFYKHINSKSEFKFVSGTQGVVWCLTELEDTLFCGHDSGTFIIKDNTAEKIIDVQGTWNIKQISKNLLLQGNYNGLYVIEKTEGSWNLRNKIKGYNLSSKFFEIHNQNEILVSHEYKGVYNVKLSDDFTKAVSIIKDTSINKELNSSLVKYNNDILFTCRKGIFKFNERKKAFAKDTLLSKLIISDDYTSGRLVYISANNSLWSFSKHDLSYLAPGKLSNTPKIHKISFSQSLPRGQTGYENISHDFGEKYLIGTSSGYVIVDLDKVINKHYSISINTIVNSGLKTDDILVDRNALGVFKNQENNVGFYFSVPEYDKYADTQYQYQLKGMDERWSEWTSNSSVQFKNLAFGDYTFNVRAKIGNDETDNVASYSFNIERPWLLSDLMIFLYFLIIALFSLFMHNMYKRYYRKQRERLVLQSKREIERKELENKQQLMFFNNEKLRQDIESKNRELGVSTMSLIKKNEFLNSIKSELKNASKNDRNLKSVIKMIDRNLNNNDDWHVFEEAFNNADKDFLKKVKSDHPSLTPNDLRLCAYLRLNLSSKEIAPLLNISPRSVEVKRYRLRKKLNLEHESSLTDYILEI